MVTLTHEEKELLVALLISTDVAKELVISEINDIEVGEKKLETKTYQQLIELYEKIS
ncbi:antirepressor AbbA [Sutcliffiella horikoshii]|uniref:antirepressor AbbA n=1 Tax=Sutcliffiella horikoshii TaxID=79883 RepID=UPI000B12CEF1|nr:antirepressor AbbA [Sutcliffiella horikoshii]MCM3616454.1 antirepressor AbbA [Sutcliffiella horikoshii]